ncbi:hypothetical protein FOL47_003490, partial [Perkinsus chesapeaki]
MVPDAVNTPVPTTPINGITSPSMVNLGNVGGDGQQVGDRGALQHLSGSSGVPGASIRYLRSGGLEQAERSLGLADRLTQRELVDQIRLTSTPLAAIPQQVAVPVSDGHSEGRSYISDYLRGAVALDSHGADTKRITATAQLPIPDAVQYAGEDDSRPVSAWVRSFSQVVRIYRLDAETCWSFLIRAVDAGVLSDIFDFLKRSMALEVDIVTKLSMTERFMIEKYQATEDPVRWRDCFDGLKQGSAGRITSYHKRVKKMVSAGRCIDINLSESEILKRFIDGLRSDYKKVVNPTHAHHRSLETLAKDLSYWEDRNYGIRPDPLEKSNDKVKVIDSSGVEQLLSILANGNGQSSATSSRDSRQCYFCHKFGHIKRDCPARFQWLVRKGLISPEENGQKNDSTANGQSCAPSSTTSNAGNGSCTSSTPNGSNSQATSNRKFGKIATLRDADDEIRRLNEINSGDPSIDAILRQSGPGARVQNGTDPPRHRGSSAELVKQRTVREALKRSSEAHALWVRTAIEADDLEEKERVGSFERSQQRKERRERSLERVKARVADGRCHKAETDNELRKKKRIRAEVKKLRVSGNAKREGEMFHRYMALATCLASSEELTVSQVNLTMDCLEAAGMWCPDVKSADQARRKRSSLLDATEASAARASLTKRETTKGPQSAHRGSAEEQGHLIGTDQSEQTNVR